MANSLMQIVSDGSLSTIPLTIKFFEQSHIKVFVNNVELPDGTYTFAWSGATTITITPAVALGAEVSIRRKTPANQVLHDFQAGAVFSEASIDENFRQDLFLLQEAKEQSLVTDLFTDIDMHGNKVRNLGNAVLGGDATPLSQVQQIVSASGGNPFVDAQLFEALRRSYAGAGYNVVGTFRGGFTYVNANDIGIDEATGKGFTGPVGPVAAGTGPASGGFVDRSGDIVVSASSYANIRSYTGPASKIYCTGRSNVFDNAYGAFVVDPSDTTSPDDDGLVLIDANGGRWKRIYEREVSPAWFGVTGNEVTDDSVALQKSFNVALTKGTVFLAFEPWWVIRVTQKILFYSNTRMYMNGATILRDFDTSATGVNTLACLYPSEADHAKNIFVLGGKFDNNGLVRQAQANIFEFAFVRGVTFRDCDFLDVAGAHAVDLSRFRDVKLDNCRFMGFKDWVGDRRFSEAIQAETPLFASDNIANLKTIGCYFGKSDSLPSWAVGVGNHGSVDGAPPVIGVKIRGNTFDANTYAGVRGFSRWEDIDIDGNTFINFTAPAIIFTGRRVTPALQETSRGVKIRGNTFKACNGATVIVCLAPTGSAGVDGNRMFHRGWVVANNHFEACAGTLIDTRWVSGLSITGNTADSCTDVGFRGDYVRDVSISGNSIDTTEAIFYLTETAGVFAGTGLSKRASIVGNVGVNGLRGVHINCAYDGFTVSGNNFEKISGVAVVAADTGAKNGVFSNNTYSNPTAAELFADITASCSNVICVDNVHPSANLTRNLAIGGSYSVMSGSGSPEGSQRATLGSSYRDVTGGKLYNKESGGNTNIGWVMK